MGKKGNRVVEEEAKRAQEERSKKSDEWLSALEQFKAENGGWIKIRDYNKLAQELVAGEADSEADYETNEEWRNEIIMKQRLGEKDCVHSDAEHEELENKLGVSVMRERVRKARLGDSCLLESFEELTPPDSFLQQLELSPVEIQGIKGKMADLRRMYDDEPVRFALECFPEVCEYEILMDPTLKYAHFMFVALSLFYSSSEGEKLRQEMSQGAWDAFW